MILLIKQYRKEKKLTQKEIAEKTGVSERQYRDIELGKSFPRKKTMNALEDLFEKPQRVLLAKNVEEVPKYLEKHLH